jgi:hypothetical protein
MMSEFAMLLGHADVFLTSLTGLAEHIEPDAAS